MKSWTWRRTSRAAAAMLAAILGLAGLPNVAPAFQFSNGDLVLAIYGNNTEFYYDVGTATSLLSPGTLTNINISALVGDPFGAGSGVVGGPQTQWSLLARNVVAASPAANGVFVYASSQNNSAGITIVPAISASNTRIQGWDSALLASTGATPTGSGAQVFLNSTDPAAFSNPSNFDLDGTLGGSWNAGGMKGSLGDILTMIQGQARTGPASGATGTNILSDAGRAVILANGQLTICGGSGCSLTAVPVPAAVVLFGTGLIGLIGIARRKLTTITGNAMPKESGQSI